jgi:hypothetical protein
MGKPSEFKPNRDHYAADYLQSEAARDLGLKFDDDVLNELERVYSGALLLSLYVMEKAIRPAGRVIDFELSVDETEEVTTGEAHFYVVNELRKIGVEIDNIAPRFVGEFQKAVDYIGNLNELREQIKQHAKIADYFGHKLSLHSGSEKYSVFPIIAQETKGRCHVKTAGTSWMEVVECISKGDAKLFRDMFAKALESLDEAKKLYVVSCDPGGMLSPKTMSDKDLPTLMKLEESDSRQLMHITYGFILADESLNRRVYDFLDSNRKLYEAEALDLYNKHLGLLK